MKRVLFVATLLIILGLVCAAGGTYYISNEVTKPLELKQNTLFSIEKGGSAHRTIKQLRNGEMTDISPIVAKVWLKFFAASTDIKSGTYMLLPGQSLADIFTIFTQGDEYFFSVSLVEGLTLAQWHNTLKGIGEIEFDLGQQAANDSASSLSGVASSSSEAEALAPDMTSILLSQTNTLAQLGVSKSEKLDNTEGLYLADTYFFTKGTKASEILTRAHIALVDFLNSEWEAREVDLPLATPYDALILASIIEKETAVPEERDLIAGVFVNRLNRGMRLQTDPTVIYGIGPSFDGNITRKHLRTRTPYNTYVIKGLPPTPIAMAGKAAIRAALKPRTTEALYFVAKGDGSHQFSNTLSEHNAAVRQYQLRR
ncbi:endolytic transglycosylase MltG [Alteromonas sp. BMJM2]|uniref:endolytic transglycosylase MltG n=1 Tax=Alteromonas sp. BMJM2 TaxID=2954241 RepID=UPI0022B57E26|nr:endolytic transglycosylase MltG [Alteromonas sp. BMJM2]